MLGSSEGIVNLVENSVISARILLTDGTVKKESFFVPMARVSLEETKLADLRTTIAGPTQSKEMSCLPFCSKEGGIVPDSYLLKEYLDILQTNIDDKVTVFDVYLQKTMVPEPGPKSEAALQASEMFDSPYPPRVKGLGETSLHLNPGSAAKYVPELEEQEWSIINQSNYLCYGIQIVRQKQGKEVVPVGVRRARYPAFRFKKRIILSDALISTSLRDVKMYLRIPDHMIDDQSYVSIYETQNKLQSSLAASSFSKFDVSAAVSGGAFGFSLGAEASYGEDAESEKTGNTSTSKKKVTLAYNFPRVTVFLDKDSLELTEQCEADLKQITDKAGFTSFLDSYGEFFSTRVQLGGRLFATEEVDVAAKESTSKTAKAMRAAAAASFSGWGATASVSASTQSKSSQSEASSSIDSSMALSWQANGGDTLLCNDPKAWAATVAQFWNWRITKQYDVAHIIDLLSQFSTHESLPTDIAKWKVETSKKAPAKAAPQIPGSFTLNADGFDKGRYLAVFTPNKSDLSHAAMAYNTKMGRIAVETSPSFYTRGCALLLPKDSEPERPEVLFQVETTDGNPVTKLAYETRYLLKHSASKRYVDWADGNRFMFGDLPKGYSFAFQDAEGNTNVGEIMNGAKVKLQAFGWPADTTAYGYLAICAEDMSDYAYLHAAAVDKTKAQVMVFKTQ